MTAAAAAQEEEKRNRKTHTKTHEVGERCYQRPWKTCRTSWSDSTPPRLHPLLHPVRPHSQSSCEKQFEQKVSLNLRSRRRRRHRHRCLTHRIPPLPSPSRFHKAWHGKAISYPQSGHFSVSLQPFLLLLLFYSALISKVALRVPKIISNGITLNEMQSTSSRRRQTTTETATAAARATTAKKKGADDNKAWPGGCRGRARDRGRSHRGVGLRPETGAGTGTGTGEREPAAIEAAATNA